MTDTPPLLARKVLGGLRPANKACEDALAALDGNVIRIRITRTRGNAKRMNFYWAILGVAAPLLSEKVEGEALSVKMLHKILKTKNKLYREVVLPSGEVYQDLDSISFHSMTEPDRAAHLNWTLATLSKWLGVEIDDLRREGKAHG